VKAFLGYGIGVLEYLGQTAVEGLDERIEKINSCGLRCLRCRRIIMLSHKSAANIRHSLRGDSRKSMLPRQLALAFIFCDIYLGIRIYRPFVKVQYRNLQNVVGRQVSADLERPPDMR
jgi:hypothetical protein